MHLEYYLAFLNFIIPVYWDRKYGNESKLCPKIQNFQTQTIKGMHQTKYKFLSLDIVSKQLSAVRDEDTQKLYGLLKTTAISIGSSELLE